MQLFNGLEYLMIDIAGSFGLDKLTWQERLDWFHKNEDNLENQWKKADKPAMYLAGVEAYKRAKRGIPIGYMINLDATHSGLQMLSVLTGDESGAKLCNIVNDGEKRNDSYTIIFNNFKSKVKQNLGNITRDNIKIAIMTAFYSSTKQPKELVGEELYPVFCETMSEMAPYAWHLNNFMLEAWDPNALYYAWDMPDGFHVHLPVETMVEDAFEFGGKKFTFNHVENIPQNRGRSLGANLTHSVDSFICREMTARCMYNFDKTEALKEVKNLNANSPFLARNTLTSPKGQKVMNNTLTRLMNLAKETGYYSMRILDVINHENFWLVPSGILEKLISSLPDKPFEILTIHDCYRCHPNYGNDVRKQYQICMQELSDSRLLEHILQSICKSPTLQINKPKNLIVDGEYALS